MGIAKKIKLVIQAISRTIAAARHHFCTTVGVPGGESDWEALIAAPAGGEASRGEIPAGGFSR